MARIVISIDPLPTERPRARKQLVVCSRCGPVGGPHGLHTLATAAQDHHLAQHKAALTTPTTSEALR
ncbi:hypothetical protein ACLQ2C_36580 [Streptomyces sp. DT73]|uniref:hypothetical protein n=1 Tax=Streptomyces sp. DT73 TaxID=3393420 RepID=UPI003CEDDB0F